MPQAPGERLGVALRRRGEGERARVLVDPEREGGCLVDGDGAVAAGEDADERGRQGAVGADDHEVGVGPVGWRVAVVVEDDALDLRGARQRLESLVQPVGVHRVDDDQAAYRRQVDAGGLDRADLVGEQAVQLAHVAVERRGQADDRLGVEAACSDHRRVGVEVRGGVGCYELAGPHGAIVPAGATRCGRSPRSRSTRPTAASPPGSLSERAACRRRSPCRARSSPRSRRGS